MELLTIDNRMRSGELYRLLHPKVLQTSGEAVCITHHSSSCYLLYILFKLVTVNSSNMNQMGFDGIQ